MRHPVASFVARLAAVSLLAAAVAGCKHAPAPAPQPEPRPIGGDRDAHGCLTPAGYTWCARDGVCVRPWEYAKERGFENTATGFAAHCRIEGTPPAP